MPTVNIDATYQGYIQRSDSLGSEDWGTTRNAGSGTSVFTFTTATTALAVRSRLTSSRGDISQAIHRTFLFFDLTSLVDLSGKTITDLTLRVLGAGSNNNADTIIIPASAWGGDGSSSTLSTGNFSNVTFGSGNTYSSEKTTWTTSGYNDYTLNSRAIDDANAIIPPGGFGGVERRLNLAIVEHDYDFSNVQPSDPTDVGNDVRFLGAPLITLKLDYDDGGIEAVNAVKKANIDKITVVSKPEIGKIIDIDF